MVCNGLLTLSRHGRFAFRSCSLSFGDVYVEFYVAGSVRVKKRVARGGGQVPGRTSSGA